MPKPPEWLLTINADAQRVGMGYVNANRTWEQLAQDVRKYPGIHLKHPFGFWSTDARPDDMVFDQTARLAEYAKENPDDVHLQADADFAAFVRAWSERPAKQFLSIYVGRLSTFRGMELTDTPQTIAERAYAELATIRAACPDMVTFDNDYPRDEIGSALSYLLFGPRGAQVLLHEMLRKDGIQVGLEPAPVRGIKRSKRYWYVFSDNFASQVKGDYEAYRDGKFTDPHQYPCFFETRSGDIEVIRASQERGEIPLVFWSKLPEELK